MIEYYKSDIDATVLRLLGKLGEFYPISSLVLDINNKHRYILKVLYDNKLYGILVVKGGLTRTGLFECVIFHAIAEDKIDEHFTSILSYSLPGFAAMNGFDLLRIHAGRPGLCRIAARWMGKPKEYIYELEVNKWKTQEIANLQQLSQQVRQPQTHE